MALSDKDILITPNKGAAADPKIEFKGADASTASQTITLNVYPTNGGTISFEGSAGQLFSIANTMTGTIYSVNDVSGIPSIEVIDTGLVKVAQYNGNVLFGTGTDDGVNKVQVSGGVKVSGIVSSNNVVETSNTASIAGSALTLDLKSGSTFNITLNSNISSMTLSNVPSAGLVSVLLIFTSDGTARSVTWPASIKWEFGVAPSITSTLNKRTLISLLTVDGGSTWFGLVLGQEM